MLTSRDKFFINGQWVTPHSSARIEIFNPANDARLGTVPDADARDVDAAVRAANAALDGWRNTPPAERAAYIEKISAGLKARTPQGTYFVMADFSDVFDGDDIDFSRFLTSEFGVACIPPTFFYSTDHAHMASTQARFAFCKSDETLRQVGERLAHLGK